MSLGFGVHALKVYAAMDIFFILVHDNYQTNIINSNGIETISHKNLQPNNN